MVIDHIGVCLFPGQVWIRVLGRFAFPIYAFLLVEGYKHTRSIKNYLIKLGVMAVISEVPYDLVTHGRLWDFSDFNCFVTLFLGLLSIWLYDRIQLVSPVYRSLAWVPVGIATVLTWGIHSDFELIGIPIIFIFYTMKKKKVASVCLITFLYGLMSWTQLAGVLAFIPLHFYNGKRGYDAVWLRWIFYFSYPVHLMILYMICVLR